MCEVFDYGSLVVLVGEFFEVVVFFLDDWYEVCEHVLVVFECRVHLVFGVACDSCLCFVCECYSHARSCGSRVVFLVFEYRRFGGGLSSFSVVFGKVFFEWCVRLVRLTRH